MTVAAVVCEYNPFHNGHKKQFAQIRRALGPDTAIVGIMSGRYVQRGEPAIFHPAVRARAAVECGASLILELPVTAALSSAEGFAQGAVELLDRLGTVDYLCFGSELGQTQPLWDTARHLLDPAFDSQVKRELEAKVSYAVARTRALTALGYDAACLERPNDILAVEYCKALLRLDSTIRPLAFRREGSYHADTPEPENPSATSLRQLPVDQWGPYVPPAALAVYRQAVRHDRTQGERAMLAVLRRLPEASFETVPYGSEGLWRRFRRACREQGSVEGILDAVKSKRYAYSRIARMCLCAFLGLTQADMARRSPYVRVLALDARGRQVLKAAKDVGELPILHAGQSSREAYWDLERRCADLYPLFGPAGADGWPICRGEKVFYKNK